VKKSESRIRRNTYAVWYLGSTMAREHFKKLHPEFRPLAQSVLLHVGSLADLCGIKWYIAASWRSPARQWANYKKGREKIGVDWVKIQHDNVVTNAVPSQTPHCVTLEGLPGDLIPASCALDVALIAPDGRGWLSDDDPRWGIVGAAIGLSGLTGKLEWGGMWNSIRDCPHIELKNWRDYRETSDRAPF